jgi:hypothetical protein
MATIITRAGKGSPLTHNEVDANFTNLNTDKLEASDLTAGTGVSIAGTTITNAAPDQTVSITGSGIVSVSGTYPNFEVAATALQAADIGVSVQAYDANLTSFVSAFTLPTTDGTAGQALATNGAGTIAFVDVAGDPTKATLTKSFVAGETSSIALSAAITSGGPVVAVTKEIPQTGVSSKGGWDVSATASNYELYDEAPATSLTIEGWAISGASFLQSFSVAAQETDPRGMFFKPDGLKMYIVGQTGDDVNEYNLSTAWDVSTASFLQLFSVAAQETSPHGIFFKPDGLKMYVVGIAGDDVNEYNLSTAWDVSTASFLQLFSVATQETLPTGISFKPDGLKMYIVGSAGQDVNEYNLSTAWDVSTASFLQVFSVAAQEASPSDVFFKPDGLKMYITGGGQDVNEYNLSTAWDVSTASFLQLFSVAAQETGPSGIFFKPDGLTMYIVGNTGDAVYEYNTLTFALGTGSFSASDVGKRIFVDDGGEAILTATDGSFSLVSEFGASTYTSGNWSLTGLDVDATNGITLNRFEERTWDVSTSSFLQTFSVSAQDTVPVSIFFKPDGLKMYIVGQTGRDVNEYNLSTAWDVSSASFLQLFSVAAQETASVSIFFKPDGTKMYVIGTTGDDVNEYNLSTAWNISTASFLQNFSVAAQDTAPFGIFFKPDGTKMYIVGQTGDDVNEYNLSTAWDVSSASFLQLFSVAAQDIFPRDIFFKPDGLKMYVLGGAGGDVNEYNLSTAWDISSASFRQNFSVAAQEDTPTGLFFRQDGLKMYIIGTTGDDVNEYDVGSLSQPTAQYLPALTSTGGQIDSQYWTDINGMTADDVDNDGQVYYAVSTDDRITWKVAKASDGERPIVRNNGGTWEYNSDAGVSVGVWDVSTASFLQSRGLSAQDTVPTDVFFKPDGTKMYVTGNTGDDVNEYNLSTAWDISSASFLQNFSVAGQDNIPVGIFFKPDGLKMYVLGLAGVDINEYNLSTAWNISTASFLQNFSVAGQDTSPTGMFFRSDGLKMYVVGGTGDDINEYNLSTAWNISTASFLQNFSVAGQDTSPTGIFFKPDGLKMYVVAQVADGVNEYNLSTAWDVSTASFLQVFSVSAQDNFPRGPFFKPDGLKMYVIGSSLYEYDIGSAPYATSATWTSATTNNEFASIAQAMTVAANQMDKAQLDAVTDGSHFALGNTLDLAIIPYLASAGTAPTSDAVAINYDAAVLNKGAILGTDYDYDFPESDVVRLTSLATQNLKVRIV